MPGWSHPGFDDSTWQKAELVAAARRRAGSADDRADPHHRGLKPVAADEPQARHLRRGLRPGVLRRRCGSRSPGRPGREVRMHTAFNVTPDGLLNAANDRSALNTRRLYPQGRAASRPGTRASRATPRGRPGRRVFRACRRPKLRGPGRPHRHGAGRPIRPAPTTSSTGSTATPAGAPGCRTAACRWSPTATSGCPGRATRPRPPRARARPSTSPASTTTSCTTTAPIRATDGSLQEILPPYWTFNSQGHHLAERRHDHPRLVSTTSTATRSPSPTIMTA